MVRSMLFFSCFHQVDPLCPFFFSFSFFGRRVWDQQIKEALLTTKQTSAPTHRVVVGEEAVEGGHVVQLQHHGEGAEQRQPHGGVGLVLLAGGQNIEKNYK